MASMAVNSSKEPDLFCQTKTLIEANLGGDTARKFDKNAEPQSSNLIDGIWQEAKRDAAKDGDGDAPMEPVPTNGLSCRLLWRPPRPPPPRKNESYV